MCFGAEQHQLLVEDEHSFLCFMVFYRLHDKNLSHYYYLSFLILGVSSFSFLTYFKKAQRGEKILYFPGKLSHSSHYNSVKTFYFIVVIKRITFSFFHRHILVSQLCS